MDPNSSAMGKQEEKVVQTMINPDQCQYFVARKHRQCKFKPAEGSLYCHAHASDLANKIECPFEKGMYIDSNKYESHLQNCPKVKNKRK